MYNIYSLIHSVSAVPPPPQVFNLYSLLSLYARYSPCSVSVNVPDLQLVFTLTLVLEDPSQMLVAIHFSFYTRHKHRNEVGMAAVAL